MRLPVQCNFAAILVKGAERLSGRPARKERRGGQPPEVLLFQLDTYGLWQQSNDRTVAKDIDRLSKQYYDKVQKEEGTVLPYFVLSRNYDE